MNDVSTLGQPGSPARADRTSSGKEHFEVLDGLRGSAAILIVIFHVFNYSFGWDTPLSLMHHAYLADDFFFDTIAMLNSLFCRRSHARRRSWTRPARGGD